MRHFDPIFTGEASHMIMDVNALLTIAGGLTALGGAYQTISVVLGALKKRKNKYRQSILDEAKAEAGQIKTQLEAKIDALGLELKSQKENLSKDLLHLRETYNAEIRVLGEKIDETRRQLDQQHSQLVNLLTSLIEKT
jgi:hypothetical protein